eukprot:IDg23040t1
MGCISANGDALFSMWGFKGLALRYRQVELPNGSFRIESASHLLPADSVFAMRPERGGVDSPIFMDWCQ